MGAGSAAPRLDLWEEAWSLDPRRASPSPAERAEARRAYLAQSARAPAEASPRPARSTKARTSPLPQSQAPSRPHASSSSQARRTSRAPERTRARSQGRFSLPAIGFVAVWIAVVVVSPFLMNVAAMQLDWKLANLEEQRDELTAERSRLKTQVATLSSAPRIREEADRLGMSLAKEVDYVILGDGGEATVLAQLPTRGSAEN